MESILKKVLTGKSDEESHRYFIRYGKGAYGRRFVISMAKGNRIKLKASFELANDFARLAAEFGGGDVSGIVLSKADISSIMSKNNIRGNSEEKRGGLFYKNNIDEQRLNGKQISELVGNSYFSLLDAKGSDFMLKTKKSLPKPGKDKEKIDDKFCLMEIDGKYWLKIKEAFFWDLPECKKAYIEHEIKISEIILPKGEKEPAKIRELAKRKGTIVRKMIADGKETSREIPFEA